MVRNKKLLLLLRSQLVIRITYYFSITTKLVTVQELRSTEKRREEER